MNNVSNVHKAILRPTSNPSSSFLVDALRSLENSSAKTGKFKKNLMFLAEVFSKVVVIYGYKGY